MEGVEQAVDLRPRQPEDGIDTVGNQSVDNCFAT
jgi:hypothetical protein